MNSFVKTFLITSLAFVISFGIARANSSDLFSKWAWSENIGWVSFNCTNEATCDPEYGVTFSETDGDLKGQAWSENIGWISFKRSEAGNPPAPPFNGGSGPIAQIDLDTNELLGWGRALSYGDGWDGWIKLRSTTTPTYGVTRSTSNQGGIDKQELYGFAWGGDVIGWLSFNNCTTTDPGSCSATEYAVETYGGDTTEPYSWISSPPAGFSTSSNFTLYTNDSDSGSGLDTDTCEYKIINYDSGGTEQSSSGWNSRNCSSTVDISVGEGTAPQGCGYQGEETCYLYVRSKDLADNTSTPSLSEKSIVPYNIDWTTPIPGKLYDAVRPTATEPIDVIEGKTYTLESNVTDNVNVNACALVINGVQQDEIVNLTPGCKTDCTASADYQFTNAGTYHNNFMTCRDAAGNLSDGEPMTFFTVGESSSTYITDVSAYSAHCDSPNTECTNQFSCCTEYTTQENCCVKFNVSATEPEGRDIDYNWDFGYGNTTSTEDPSYHFDTADTYTISVTASSTSGSDSETINISVSDPTLSVDMSADPSFGSTPLKNVDLRDIVSGTTFGTINYKFNCDGIGTPGVTTTALSTEDYTATDICTYNSTTTHTATSTVSRGNSSVIGSVDITVEGVCTEGATTTCTSAQGCTELATCTGGSWVCATSTCTIGETETCDNGGEKTCNDSCEWSACTEPECSSDYDCYCSIDQCKDADDDGHTDDYYDYPTYGSCTDYTCDIGTGTGEPCEPTIETDATSSCDFPPICDSLTATPSSGISGESSSTWFTTSLEASAVDDDGTVENYEFSFGDSTVYSGSTNPKSHSYAGPGEAAAEGSATTYTAVVQAQDNRGNWSTYNASTTVTVTKNYTPVADINCDPSGCLPIASCNPDGQSVVYNGSSCMFDFTNESTDDDSTNAANNNHITKSTWSVFPDNHPNDPADTVTYDGTKTTATSSYPPSGIANAGDYFVKLEVEDEKGGTSATTADFYLRDDIVAGFECTLTDPNSTNTTTTWRSCDGLSVSEDALVYFRDVSEGSQISSTSTSDYYDITSWDWTFAKGTPSSSSASTTSASFEQGENAGLVTLVVEDEGGRTDTQTHDLVITIPLPEWQEIAPID